MSKNAILTQVASLPKAEMIMDLLSESGISAQIQPVGNNSGEFKVMVSENNLGQANDAAGLALDNDII